MNSTKMEMNIEKQNKQPEQLPQKSESKEPVKVPDTLNIAEQLEGYKPLRRGIWAEHLADGQELPLGGSMFTDELTTKLKLDFATFESELEKFTEANIKDHFEKNKAAIVEWLEKVKTQIDPYLFFALQNVQIKVQKLLEIRPDYKDDDFSRTFSFAGNKVPRLSEMKGKAMCAEQAALGQYLLQKIGIKSAYMSGLTMIDAKDNDEEPGNHSFLVVENPANQKENYIFDIARPRSQNNLPRILKPVTPFTYDLLKNRKALLVKTNEVLQGGELWFGVGDTTMGTKQTLE